MEKDFIGEHEISPLARRFPRLSPKAYKRFKADLEKHGQKDPIARHRGLIIDGVNRLLASIELGMEPWIEDLDDNVDPVAYVSSKNNHRRDLDKDQKIIIAFRFSEESTSGRPPQENDAHAPPFLTMGEAADEFGVSRRSVEQARRVLKEDSPAVPELKQAALDCLVKCSDAEGVINMPAEVQRRAVELKRSGQARTVTAAAKMVEDELRQEEDAEARQFNLALSLSETVTLLHSAVGDLHRQVEADSVDLILAFPPTDERNLPLFSGLAGFAAHALAPGGRMALLVNAEYLPAILQRLTHDEVRWITELDYRSPGRGARILRSHPVTVCRWPLLIYGKRKGTSLPAGVDFVSEPLEVGATGSRKHSQLLELGMKHVVERLVRPGGTVCDPLLLGRAGIAIAARQHGCHFIGASDTPKFISEVKGRLNSEEAASKSGEVTPEADPT